MTYLNATIVQWLGADSPASYLGHPFYTLLTGAGKIYFETHLRPMLIIEGRCQEISLEVVGASNSRLRIYLSGSVTKNAAGEIDAIHLVCFEGTDRHHYEQELLRRRRQAESYEAIVAASPDAIINVDADRKVLAWNAAAERLLGYTQEEVLGRQLTDLIELREQVEDIRDTFALADNDQSVTAETVRRTKAGDTIPVESSIGRIKDERGNFAGTVEILRDITDRKRNEQTIKTLNREVLHRSKNLLAVVQGIANMTARHTAHEEFTQVFSQRLGSIARNLELLVDRNWTTIGLGSLVRQQLAHLGADTMDRVTLCGPEIQVNAAHAEALGMAIFELSTNAVKHGALGTPDGSVEVSWTKSACKTVSLTWRETGVSVDETPKRTGFGSMITGDLLEAALGGEVSAKFLPEGLVWSCTFEHQI